jgi:hypothetical protein
MPLAFIGAIVGRTVEIDIIAKFASESELIAGHLGICNHRSSAIVCPGKWSNSQSKVERSSSSRRQNGVAAKPIL